MFRPLFVKVGLILRESRYLNSVLYSSECWHSLHMRDILKFERQDLYLLRIILNKAHSKTATDSISFQTVVFNLMKCLQSPVISLTGTSSRGWSVPVFDWKPAEPISVYFIVFQQAGR